MLTRSPWPTFVIAILFLIGNTGSALYTLHGQSPGAFLSLYQVGACWAFAWWILTDRREHAIQSFIDEGWFLFLGWPFVLPYHLWKTRRARGCLVLLIFAGLFIAAYAVGLVLYFLLPHR